MSQENVETARRIAEKFNARDNDGLLELLDPDVEWVPIMAALEGRVYRGHEGVLRWLDDLESDWDEFQTRPDEFHDLGDRVLALGSWYARGRASGIEFENQPASWLWQFKAGRAIRLRTYTDRAEALEAAGITGAEGA